MYSSNISIVLHIETSILYNCSPLKTPDIRCVNCCFEVILYKSTTLLLSCISETGSIPDILLFLSISSSVLTRISPLLRE